MPEVNDTVSEEKSNYAIKLKAQEEGFKLYYDTSKHTTTLSTAAVLLLITFLEKIFPTPRWKILIALTFGSFILSMFLSIIAMLHFAETIKRMGNLDEKESNKANVIYYLSVLFFAYGIISLAIFTLGNFYS